MEIIELEYLEFDKIFQNPNSIYGTGVFGNLNKSKVDSVHFLAFKKKKYRIGIAIGIRNNVIKSPFSAPFGGFIFVNEDVGISYFEEALNCLVSWSKIRGGNKIEITLPPTIYGVSNISKQVNSFFNQGFDICQVDLNHVFELNLFNERENYTQKISYNARKNLRIAFESGLSFVTCIDDNQRNLAYSIIEKNRNSKGFPLRMSWDQVYSTSKIVMSDFFLVETIDSIPIASAIVFHVNNKVVQVIYWGDLSEYSNLKPMNFLAYHIFQFYKKMGKKFVDIGPSTEYSIPNYGLCDFKESIGCETQQKFTFVKKT